MPDAAPMWLQNWTESSTYIGGVMFSVITAALVLRRRVSKSNLDVGKDKAELSIIEKALVERDRAMEEARQAWDVRTADAAKIAAFEVTVRMVTEENRQLREEMKKLREEVQRMRDELTRAQKKH